jgi:putative integral membrane protein (TIGR02587 family)
MNRQQTTKFPDIDQAKDSNWRFAIAIARAFGGAIIFSLPMLMTMEMWYLGFYIDPLRLALLLLLFFPLLIALAYFSGFEETHGWIDYILDAFVAYAVGFVTAGIILLAFGVLEFGMSSEEVIGKISIQVVPASIGAMLAQSLLGGNNHASEGPENQGYWSELLLMLIGALFLSLNIAPTEEMVLISYQMSEWHAIGLALISLTIMHAFVYAVEFRGQEAPPSEGTSIGSLFLRFTVVGYAIALLMSLYVLWTFGQIQGMAPVQILMATIVLGFPAAVGAAAARLIL